MSTLYAWIGCFKCFLHVSYKLNLKKWQTRGSEDKEKVEMRKKNIQKGFRLQLGLIIIDAQESCNKYIKRFGEHFTGKYSRLTTMEDLSLRLLRKLPVCHIGSTILFFKFLTSDS